MLLVIAVSALTTLVLAFFGKTNEVDVSGHLVYELFRHALIPAVLEELLFRYIPIKLLSPYSRRGAILVSALLFSLVHLNLFQIPYALLAGVVFGFLTVASGSILPSSVKAVQRGKSGAAGQLLLSYGFMTYVAIIIALVTNYILKRTRTGLELRAVGENPATADAAGININKYKYFSVCIGCMIAGLGGLYYVMDYANGVWSNDAFGDRGWIAIALVIFCIWRPNVAILESILFGGLLILYLYLPTGTNFATKELYKMIPYIVTIIVLILISIRNKKDSQPPEALGLPYFREDR
jgi:simple sugar transport system permease protein